MDTKRNRQAQQVPDKAAEQAARAELHRRRARRNPGGALSEPDTAGDDVRSVVIQLADRVDELSGQLDRARRRVAELETLTDDDVMLPVLNRRGIMRELGRAIAFVSRYEPQASLIYVQLQSLKGINESYGYGAGDAILSNVASCINANVRSSDIVGRVGGDAFAIILWSAIEKDARRKAAILSGELADSIPAGERLNVSIAVVAGATGIFAKDTPEAVLSRAASRSRATLG